MPRQRLPAPLESAGCQLAGVQPRGLLARVGLDQVVYGLALAERIVRGQTEQVIAHQFVNLFPHPRVRHVRAFGGGSRLAVVEVPSIVFAPADQVRAQRAAQRRKAKRVPCEGWGRRIEQARDTWDQRGQVPLAEAPARQRDRRGERPRQRRPLARIVRHPSSGPLEEARVQPLDVAGQGARLAHDHRVQPVLVGALGARLGAPKVVAVQQVQLLERRHQPQGVAVRGRLVGPGFFDQFLNRVPVRLAMVAIVDALRDFAGFVPGERDERLDDEVRPPGERLGLGPGDRGRDQADVRREPRGQPGKLFGLRRPLEPVERVEEQHHAPFRRGPGQQLRKRLLGFRPLVDARGYP